MIDNEFITLANALENVQYANVILKDGRQIVIGILPPVGAKDA